MKSNSWILFNNLGMISQYVILCLQGDYRSEGSTQLIKCEKNITLVKNRESLYIGVPI